MRPISTLRGHVDDVRDEFREGVDRVTVAAETQAVTVSIVAVIAVAALLVATAALLKPEGVKPPWN